MPRTAWIAGLVLSLVAFAQPQGPIEPRKRRPKATSSESTASDPEGPPRLERGKPYPDKPRGNAAPQPQVVGPGAEIEVDAEGRVVRGPGASAELSASSDYLDELPNFIAEQLVWRYRSESRPPKWDLQDRIECEVLYLGGKEIYQNFRRNGRPIRQGSPEYTGTWSFGEWATIEYSLLTLRPRIEMRRLGDSQVRGRKAVKYAMDVPQPMSRWRVEFEGQSLQPAFSALVWMAEDNSRVLRVEMIARDIPDSFTLDLIEVTVEYGPVMIDGREYLLPLRSENLSCKRYAKYCSKNEIDFRNHRKFTAESTVSTTDSTITFEESTTPAKRKNR